MSIDENIRYAGFWRRFAAAVIDTFLLGILSVLALLFMYGSTNPDPEVKAAYRTTEFILNYALPMALTVFFWIKYLGTPGKKLLGCQVVDARTGARLTIGQGIVRYLSYILSMIPLGLGFLWIIWDKRNQGFHDKLANSVVIIEDEARKSLQTLEKEFS